MPLWVTLFWSERHDKVSQEGWYFFLVGDFLYGADDEEATLLEDELDVAVLRREILDAFVVQSDKPESK